MEKSDISKSFFTKNQKKCVNCEMFVQIPVNPSPPGSGFDVDVLLFGNIKY